MKTTNSAVFKAVTKALSRSVLGLFIFWLMAPFSFLHAEELNDIGQLQWQSRVLLMQGSDEAKQSFSQSLENDAKQLSDRHIYWFIFQSDQVETNYPGEVSDNFKNSIKAEYFGNTGDGDVIILIGKDGSPKLFTSELDLKQLYETIDAMPMRQQEIQSQ
ncbi:DUF4174 domain-containing protein [Thalassotalea litorea]|uniref:DUF4174 domain-containing protein n=1 Tax=Thalassotalea litorea TaxID=2020715 RepID=A0A5R9IEM5_9GAMM|nr:DUF4174 domain-containing protein [Thalassotalea litorea]TLU61823.1 DUF4174 domain-containing protein [Thalassotalea litorea]